MFCQAVFVSAGGKSFCCTKKTCKKKNVWRFRGNRELYGTSEKL